MEGTIIIPKKDSVGPRLAGSELVMQDVDVSLSTLLEEKGYGLEKIVGEFVELLEDTKENKGAEAMKVRRDTLNDILAIHGSKASKKTVNFNNIFIHPAAGQSLKS